MGPGFRVWVLRFALEVGNFGMYLCLCVCVRVHVLFSCQVCMVSFTRGVFYFGLDACLHLSSFCYSISYPFVLYAQLLNASVAKAVALDEIAMDSACSSCAEDSFFVAQRCAKRALATGNAGAASAVVNHVGNTLGVDLLEALVKKVRTCSLFFCTS